jgi:hypothetical protein
MTDAAVDKVDQAVTAGNVVFYTAGDVEVATCAFSDPAFDDSGSAGGNPDGQSTANAISDDTNVTGGTISYGAVEDGDGNEIWRGDVTVTGGGGAIEVSTISPAAGETLSVTSMTFTTAAS